MKIIKLKNELKKQTSIGQTSSKPIPSTFSFKLKKYQSIGGCPGNSLGIGALVVGMEVDEAIKRLEGIKCGFRQTSCPDQLAKNLKQYKENKD